MCFQLFLLCLKRISPPNSMARQLFRFHFNLTLGVLSLSYSSLLKASLGQHFFTFPPFNSITEIHQVSRLAPEEAKSGARISAHPRRTHDAGIHESVRRHLHFFRPPRRYFLA